MEVTARMPKSNSGIAYLRLAVSETIRKSSLVKKCSVFVPELLEEGDHKAAQTAVDMQPEIELGRDSCQLRNGVNESVWEVGRRPDNLKHSASDAKSSIK